MVFKIKNFLIALVCIIVFGFIFIQGFFWSCKSKEYNSSDYVSQIKNEEYKRTGDQTYITFPEWYIVYTADEYADSLEHNLPSNFPFLTSISQYWVSYCKVHNYSSAKYPFNKDYNLMLMVIGFSHSVESGGRFLYEKSFGKIFELLAGNHQSEEDIYAYQVQREYGNFIHTTPWFDFPFTEKLKGLWEIPMWGDYPVRKFERKIILSSEYLIKAGYAKILRSGRDATFGVIDLKTRAIVRIPLEADLSGIEILESMDDGTTLVAFPRYQAFTDMVPKLVENGIQFIDIAGNDRIFITVIVPENAEVSFESSKELFKMPTLSDKSKIRYGVDVPVKDLFYVILEINRNNWELEHIYDY